VLFLWLHIELSGSYISYNYGSRDHGDERRECCGNLNKDDNRQTGATLVQYPRLPITLVPVIGPRGRADQNLTVPPSRCFQSAPFGCRAGAV